MKKSTLITTIAMIVVVVVALSTATYAWFSAATTTSASDEITTVAAADWIIMGGKVTHTDGTDSITFSSSNAIQLDMLDGLRSPDAAIPTTAYPTSAAINPTFAPVGFYEATQDGTGLATTAKAKTQATLDMKADAGVQSAANYVRIIRSGSESSTLVLTITVLTEGQNDSDFYASNGFVTYLAWTTASGNGRANTAYYHGTVANTTSGTAEDTYYVATRTAKVDAYGVSYTGYTDVDLLNLGMQAGTASDAKAGYKNASTDNVTIGGQTINQGYYYQIKVTIADAEHKLAKNSAVNIAFYAWFDGWAIDNSGSNSHATVYYEFGNA